MAVDIVCWLIAMAVYGLLLISPTDVAHCSSQLDQLFHSFAPSSGQSCINCLVSVDAGSVLLAQHSAYFQPCTIYAICTAQFPQLAMYICPSHFRLQLTRVCQFSGHQASTALSQLMQIQCCSPNTLCICYRSPYMLYVLPSSLAHQVRFLISLEAVHN